MGPKRPAELEEATGHGHLEFRVSKQTQVVQSWTPYIYLYPVAGVTDLGRVYNLLYSHALESNLVIFLTVKVNIFILIALYQREKEQRHYLRDVSHRAYWPSVLPQ